jgi:hypothetical protein
MSKNEGKLVTTLELSVKDEFDRKEPELEIYLRCVVVKVRELVELFGRGKFDVVSKLDRVKPVKTRRLSKRKPKS